MTLPTTTSDTFTRARERAADGDYASRWNTVARVLRRADDEDRAVAAIEAAVGGGRAAAVRMIERFAEGG